MVRAGRLCLINELFKQLWPAQADRFKDAQHRHSPTTRKIVSRVKTGYFLLPFCREMRYNPTIHYGREVNNFF